jgi:hypothetical protein
MIMLYSEYFVKKFNDKGLLGHRKTLDDSFLGNLSLEQGMIAKFR